MPRFLDYYRQFDELSPEEVSRALRERREVERAREVTSVTLARAYDKIGFVPASAP